MVVHHGESSPQSQHANGKIRQAVAKRQLSRQWASFNLLALSTYSLPSCLLPCIILLLLLLLHTASSFKSLLSSQRSNRIYHRSLMQTEKSQPESQRIMPETRCTSFPALSVDPRVGISRLHRRPMIDYFSYLLLNKIILIL